MLQATRTWVSRILVHPHTLSMTCGAAAGAAWIAVCAAYWTAFEPVPAARVTFALAWAVTLAFVWSSRIGGLLARVPHFWRVAFAGCGLALWPTAWKAILARRGMIPLDWYADDWTSLAAMAIPATLALIPVIAMGLGLCPAPSVDSTGTRKDPQLPFWLGVGLSWCVLPTTLFVRFGADQILVALSACQLLGAGLSLFLRGDAAEGAVSEPTTSTVTPLASRLILSMISILGAILIGGALEAANRTAEQLVIESLPFKFFGWGGFLLGAVAGSRLLAVTADRRAGLRGALLLTGLASAAVLILYPVWIRLGIWTSTNVSSLPWIVLTKGLIPLGILLPFGCAAGALWRSSGRLGTVALAIGAGYCLATVATWSINGGFVIVTCLATGLAIALSPIDSWKQLLAHQGRNRHGALLAACVCLIAVTLGCQSWLDAARSARLLFSSDTFAAAGGGHDLQTIERADRTRWLKTIEGENGVWTLWRQRANHLLVRRNGLPVGQMTIDTGLGPQNYWSVMATAVPLVVHPQADDVLCLGTPGIVEINTLLGFPVRSLTCAEADRDVRALVEYQASLAENSSRLNDGRLEWIRSTPMQLATSRPTRTYDVIVCPDSSAVPLQSQPHFTREFHTHIARHLNDGGLFCQRLNIFDFGAAPLVDTLSSLQSAFEQTCIITTDGSEILLLATNSVDPILEPGVVARLETPQVRRLCATLGGDWSMLTQLACVEPERIEELLAAHRGTTNSCGNARFTMRLASETLRWGPKWKEKQTLFTGRADLVLKGLGLEEEVEQTIARRIQDSQERHRILTEKPDDEWSYRRVLKDALKERPRTTIQRVNNEIRQTLNADDQQRKAFLIALGKAAREPAPSLAAIERIEMYAEPFDPLVTDFVHFEVAHLLGRAQETDPAREYRHWMHCIAYAPDADRSVRPVVAALDLLRRNPEIVTDPTWRWDQFSFLLDVMRVRWIGRWQSGVPSKFEAADMQHSIEAVTATLSAMDDLASHAGLDRETWKVQQRVWEDSLVTPTRTRQGNSEPRNQMLETVRQEWMRRNSELAEPK